MLDKKLFARCPMKCPTCSLQCSKSPNHSKNVRQGMTANCWCVKCSQFYSKGLTLVLEPLYNVTTGENNG